MTRPSNPRRTHLTLRQPTAAVVVLVVSACQPDPCARGEESFTFGLVSEDGVIDDDATVARAREDDESGDLVVDVAWRTTGFRAGDAFTQFSTGAYDENGDGFTVFSALDHLSSPTCVATVEPAGYFLPAAIPYPLEAPHFFFVDVQVNSNRDFRRLGASVGFDVQLPAEP